MHPYIPELKELYRQGRITRREFVQNATMLGLSFGAAMAFLTACAQQQAAAPQPTVSAPGQPTKPAAQPTSAATQAPKAPTTVATAAATQAATGAGAIKRGGTLRVSDRVMRMDDPARFSWYQPADVARHIAEYLVEVDEKGIPQPLLLEKWEASPDAKTWTLYVRKGVKWFGHPQQRELDADDVVFNITRWLKKETGSSMAGLMNYLQPSGVEKVDQYTVKLHLDRPSVEVPYAFFHYPAVIVPKEFEGDFLKQPWGTGPYDLAEYVVGERVRLKRREGYRVNGADGKPLPYLDEIIITDLGEEASSSVAAMAVGQVDYFRATPVTVPAFEKIGATVHVTPSAQTEIFRVRADKKPWTDVRVRNALKLVVDRQQMIKTAYPLGTPGYNTHSNESQPDFTSPGEPVRDVAKAKQLLAEAGYPNGIDVELVHKVDPQYEGTMAAVLKQQAEPAGIRIKLTPVPSTQYWDKWTEYDFGLTNWAHRPLASINLALAYTCGAAWNETHWCDKEWEAQLGAAAGTVDLEERKKKLAPVIKYLQENGPIVNPFHQPYLFATSKRVEGFYGIAYGYMILKYVWLKQ